MANGVVIPNKGEYINSELATGAVLKCRNSTCVLSLENFALTSSTSYANLVPSGYRPTNSIFNSALFVNGSTYKTGYIDVSSDGTLYGYIVDGGTYVAPSGYKIYGELTWSV